MTAAEPRRCAGPRTWPGGVQVIGPLLRIPGRTVHVDDLDEAVQHAAAVTEAIACLHREFPTTVKERGGVS